MNNVIIGTAGHVDHGKTSMIKALTGIDTDRLKEEKKRGITIDLGFAYLTLPSGEQVGIIDVPGHEKFIKNMLAGAGGIDFAILVIAADDGFMPQTREHLDILDLLNVKTGIIALTKIDLVDEEWLDMVQGEIRNEIKGSFLENSPIYPISSYTGEGMEELRTAIFELIENVKSRSTTAAARLPVDRIFSVHGMGTVITGTLISGTLKLGDNVQIYPSEKIIRIRNLQVHSKDVEQAFSGQRVAINLASIPKNEISRKNTLAAPSSMKITNLIDARITLLPNSKREVTHNSFLHFYHGAGDYLCKVRLLDRNVLKPGESCYAQLRFDEKIALKEKDRFIIRFYSPLETIGGGIVIDVQASLHRRNSQKVFEELRMLESDSLSDKLLQIIKQQKHNYISLDKLRTLSELDESTFSKEISKLTIDGKIFNLDEANVVLADYCQNIEQTCNKILNEFHRTNQYQNGMRTDELRSRLLPQTNTSTADIFIQKLVDDKLIRIENNKASLFDFHVQYSETDNKLVKQIEEMYEANLFSPPALEDLYNIEPSKKNKIESLFKAMVSNGNLIATDSKTFFHKSALDLAECKLRQFLETHQEISLAEFRDLISTSRKFALSLLDYFDRRGITVKIGDIRKFK